MDICEDGEIAAPLLTPFSLLSVGGERIARMLTGLDQSIKRLEMTVQGLMIVQKQKQLFKVVQKFY